MPVAIYKNWSFLFEIQNRIVIGVLQWSAGPYHKTGVLNKTCYYMYVKKKFKILKKRIIVFKFMQVIK